MVSLITLTVCGVFQKKEVHTIYKHDTTLKMAFGAIFPPVLMPDALSPVLKAPNIPRPNIFSSSTITLQVKLVSNIVLPNKCELISYQYIFKGPHSVKWMQLSWTTPLTILKILVSYLSNSNLQSHLIVWQNPESKIRSCLHHGVLVLQD